MSISPFLPKVKDPDEVHLAECEEDVVPCALGMVPQIGVRREVDEDGEIGEG
jgi:hypothetical protein